MTVDELVNKLAKPIMVLRFAKADRRTNSGAEKRANNARIVIDDIVKIYVREQRIMDKEAFAEWLGYDERPE